MKERELTLEVVRVTEAAAIASARLMGTGDGIACDQAAVDAMRMAFSELDIWGRIVIGEGELDEAPMLTIGEEVGMRTPTSMHVDIAVDPLEGTRLCAHGAPGALSVLALAEEGQFLHAPDCYMKKIAVGPAARDAIDLRESATWNLQRIAKAKGVQVSDLTAVILHRPRHDALIAEVRECGARICLISDGDVSAAVATNRERSGIDVLFGVGGSPEGVVSAAALKCMGGGFQAQLAFQNETERQRARAMGLKDPDQLFDRDDLAKGDVVFAATGITGGSLLKAVRFYAGGAWTQSLVLRSHTGTIRNIEAYHDFSRKRN